MSAIAVPVTSIPLIFFDLETTGLKVQEDRIVEIAAYNSTTDQHFVCLINPGCPIPEGASKINGITDEMVAKAPPFPVAAQGFVDFCVGNVILIAHNGDNFDLPFIKAEFKRHNLPMPEWTTLDSLKVAREFRKGLSSYKLQDLRKIYGIQADNPHRALGDVRVLHQVFSHLTQGFSIEQVYERTYPSRDQPRKVTEMTFGRFNGKPIEELPEKYVAWLVDNGILDKPEYAALKEALVNARKLNTQQEQKNDCR